MEKEKSKKISRRNVIKNGAKIAGGLYLAAPIVLAEDCVSCPNPGEKPPSSWIMGKLKDLKEFFSNGYYFSNGYSSLPNGYSSSKIYENYHSNGYASGGKRYFSNGYSSGDDSVKSK